MAPAADAAPRREQRGIQVVGAPFAFRGIAPIEATEAPRVGATGRDALREWLELDDAAIAELLPEVPA